MLININYARTLSDITPFLQYLIAVYGVELYKDKHRLYNLIADLYIGEQRLKRLYRTAIIEENLSLRIFELTRKNVGERLALLNSIAYRFAENNCLLTTIAKKVAFSFAKGISLQLNTFLKQRSDGNWEDCQGNVYSKDKKYL